MSISSALELELSLISFPGSDSILKVGREGIKEREEGKRGGGGGLFKGGGYFKCFCLKGKIIILREAINQGMAIIFEGNTVIWKAHLPERCKNNKFNAQKFSKWLYWFEFLMSSLVKQHQTIHCPLKPKQEFCISIEILGCMYMYLNTS